LAVAKLAGHSRTKASGAYLGAIRKWPVLPTVAPRGAGPKQGHDDVAPIDA